MSSGIRFRGDAAVTVLLALLREGVGNGSAEGSLADVDWKRVFALAHYLKVPAVALDGFEHLSAGCGGRRFGMDAPEWSGLRMRWAGCVLNIESGYVQHEAALRKLGAFYSSHGLGMMLLKGYGLSLNYPVPSHRPMGDIDCFLFHMNGNGAGEPAWKRGDGILSEELGVAVNNAYHHHSVFQIDDVTVENHYDFFNVPSHRSNRWIEARFKEMAQERGRELFQGVFLPSSAFNALFVIRHAAVHFAATEMDLRQLLDWMVLVKATQDDINWREFWWDAERMGMADFVRAVAIIASEEFGFDRAIFHLELSGCFEEEQMRAVADRIMDEVFYPEFTVRPPQFIRMLVWKARRWWSNRWKHKLVYVDSLISTFFFQVIAHILKPKSINI